MARKTVYSVESTAARKMPSHAWEMNSGQENRNTDRSLCDAREY